MFITGVITLSPWKNTGPVYNQFAQDVIDTFQEPVFNDYPHLPANADKSLVLDWAGNNSKI